MTHDHDGNAAPKIPDPRAHITAEEIRDVLMNDGYSAGERKAWLKDVLTELTDADRRPAGPDRAELVAQIKAILADHQSGRPIAQDVL